MPNKRTPRRRTFHIPLHNLDVETSWRVGRVTVRPKGWLTGWVEREIAAGTRQRGHEPSPAHQALMKHAREVADGAGEWATAAVVVRDKNEARDVVRDAVALLRLFQRTRHQGFNLDVQTFGLPIDVRAFRDQYVAKGLYVPSAGWQWHGVLGSWSFNRRDIVAFRQDQGFQWLTRAVGTPEQSRTDLQRRAVAALRTLNTATVMVPTGVRIGLQALALEVLFKDDGRRESQRHRFARRYAYLLCGTGIPDAQPHGPDRPACLFLAKQSKRQVEKAVEAVNKRGIPYWCSWYGEPWDLFADRDGAMHEARQEYPRGTTGRHERNVDAVILALAQWASSHGADALSWLDDEIDAFVAEGVEDFATGTSPSNPAQPGS